jgi:Protein of unknown function (DUF1579)
MKHFKSAIATAVVCAAALGVALVPAHGNAAESPLDQLASFMGDGVCSGHVMAMGKTPGHPSTGKFHGERTLDSNWVVIRYYEEQTTANPKPYRVMQYFGYDGAKKRFVSVAFDNSGSIYSTGTSSGWKGDTITFDESLGGRPMRYRDAFTRNGNDPAHHTGLMRDKHGKWIKTDEETCKRA